MPPGPDNIPIETTHTPTPSDLVPPIFSSSPSQAARFHQSPALTGENSPLRADEFTDLFGRARPHLWLVAAGVLGNHADAEDVVQEAAIIGLKKIHTFTRGSNFEAWMAQITRNTARNALRRRNHRPSPLGGDALSAIAVPPPASAGSNSGTPVSDADLERAMARLEPIARVCLLLRVVGELPYEAIATIAEIPEGTAMSHVYRARLRLRDWLQSPPPVPPDSSNRGLP